MTEIDYERVRQIIECSKHGYYEREQCRMTREGPFALSIDDILGRVCTPGSRVLDIGCGNGRTLLRNAARFGEGVGLDNHRPHIDLARENLASSGVKNVRFIEGRADNLPLEAASFDFVFSERGPLAWSDVNTFNALRVLRPGGMILAETPGPLAYHEMSYIFDPNNAPLHRVQQTANLEGMAAVLARNGVDVQLAASHMERWVFEDLYEWLTFHMSCWDYYPDRRFDTWPLPEELCHGIERFRVMTADSQGRIRITNHRSWVAGIKRCPQATFTG